MLYKNVFERKERKYRVVDRFQFVLLLRQTQFIIQKASLIGTSSYFRNKIKQQWTIFIVLATLYGRRATFET